MKMLTGAQGRVLEFVRRSIDRNGFPPTRSEIAAGLGFASANAAHEHLVALHKKGWIELTPEISRGIKLT